MTPTNAEVQDLLGNPEVVEALAAGLAGELLKHKREVIRLQAALETTTLEAREAEARADQVTGELCDVQGENAALRARVVPAIVWADEPTKSVAGPGNIWLEVSEGRDGWWEITISAQCRREGMIGGEATEHLWRAARVGRDEAKSACEAAFLRLVGCGNG